MVKFLLVALSGGALAAVPSVSPTYQIEVKWSAQVPSLKKTYTYQETHFYDIKVRLWLLTTPGVFGRARLTHTPPTARPPCAARPPRKRRPSRRGSTAARRRWGW